MKIQLFVLMMAAGFLAADEVPASKLAKELDKKVGQEVTFTDEILGKTKKQELKKYTKFETLHLRCIVSAGNEDAKEMLDTLLKERAPRRASITGTVTKHKSLQIFIEVTSIERPRYKRKIGHKGGVE